MIKGIGISMNKVLREEQTITLKVHMSIFAPSNNLYIKMAQNSPQFTAICIAPEHKQAFHQTFSNLPNNYGIYFLKHSIFVNGGFKINLFWKIQAFTWFVFILHRIISFPLFVTRRLSLSLDYLLFFCLTHFIVSFVCIPGTQRYFEHCLL